VRDLTLPEPSISTAINPFGPAEFGIRINQDSRICPLMMLIRVLPSAMTLPDSTRRVDTDSSSSEVPRLRASWLLSRSSVATTWPRQAMIHEATNFAREFGRYICCCSRKPPGSRQDSTWRACDQAPAFLPLFFASGVKSAGGGPGSAHRDSCDIAGRRWRRFLRFHLQF